MKKTGYTIIEMTVAVFIFSLLFYSVAMLLTQSRQRFSNLEDEITCSTQASMILSRLRNDLERCMAFGNSGNSFDMAQNAIRFNANVLTLSILDGSEKKEISYSYNESSRTIEYHAEDRELQFGKGVVAKFFACHQILCDDDVIRSIPYDPDLGGPEPAIPETLPNAGRSWVKIYLTMGKQSSGTKKAVMQTYVFRFFPVRLNRQIQSIWFQGK